MVPAAAAAAAAPPAECGAVTSPLAARRADLLSRLDKYSKKVRGLGKFAQSCALSPPPSTTPSGALPPPHPHPHIPPPLVHLFPPSPPHSHITPFSPPPLQIQGLMSLKQQCRDEMDNLSKRARQGVALLAWQPDACAPDAGQGRQGGGKEEQASLTLTSQLHTPHVATNYLLMLVLMLR